MLLLLYVWTSKDTKFPSISDSASSWLSRRSLSFAGFVPCCLMPCRGLWYPTTSHIRTGLHCLDSWMLFTVSFKALSLSQACSESNHSSQERARLHCSEIKWGITRLNKQEISLVVHTHCVSIKSEDFGLWKHTLHMNTSCGVPFKLQALDMHYSSLCLGLSLFSRKHFNCRVNTSDVKVLLLKFLQLWNVKLQILLEW